MENTLAFAMVIVCLAIMALRLVGFTMMRYGSDGRYLGEVPSRNRLITNLAKKGRRKGSFTPNRVAGYAMYAGYEDFPSPENFK